MTRREDDEPIEEDRKASGTSVTDASKIAAFA
jgi:hypothetical protein